MSNITSIILHLPKMLRTRLKQGAEKQGLSISEFAVNCIVQGLAAMENQGVI